jgi:hypothetical protein
MAKRTTPQPNPEPETPLEKRVDAIMADEPLDPPLKIAPESLSITPIPTTSKLPQVVEAKPAAIKTAPAVPQTLLQKLEESDQPIEVTSIAPTPKAATKSSAVEQQAKDELPVDGLDDNKTNEAVDDIVAHEGDAVLAAEDAINQARQVSEPTKEHHIRKLLHNKKVWAVTVCILVVIFGVPVSRYKLLGLVFKKTVTISVIDSTTNSPVSDASIHLGGKTADTDVAGSVKLRVPVGSKNLTISKNYYASQSTYFFAGFGRSPTVPIKLVATGRQVPITVLNLITGKPVSGVTVTALKTSAKTDSKGQATLVLPTSSVSDLTTISGQDYNNFHGTVQVTNNTVVANTFKITPVGQVYFLSNLSGMVDVVKTNLDGSGRQIVLAGTGKEVANQTSLLATQDWKYLVLEASRESSQPALYDINTATDNVVEFDSGSATFTPIGWYGHNFIYSVSHSNDNAWQSGQEVIKSYNAETGQLNQLDSNQAEGDSASYATQSFYDFTLTNGLLLYTTQWSSYSNTGNYDLSGKNNTIRGIQLATGTKKDYQNFDATATGYIQSALIKPGVIDYGVYTNQTNSTAYYQYTDTSVQPISGDMSIFNQTYPTYFFSPGNSQTFWAEPRDGKNSLFIGDAGGGSPTQIASLSDYQPYGWYGSYVLVSKSANELYVLPTTALNNTQQPVKLSDYFQPQTTPGAVDGYQYGSQ